MVSIHVFFFFLLLGLGTKDGPDVGWKKKQPTSKEKPWNNFRKPISQDHLKITRSSDSSFIIKYNKGNVLLELRQSYKLLCGKDINPKV